MARAKERAVTAALRFALIGAVCGMLSTADAATLEGSVTIDGQLPVDGVVYLQVAGEMPPTASLGSAVMDQRNLTFVPRVLPVVRGTVIEFTNSDDVQHNVFSPSAIAGKFNLGTYGPGSKRSIILDQPGDVRVLCNIHMEMEAHILVLETRYFSTVTSEGRYRITDVPAGTYTLKVWQAHWLPEVQTVALPASGLVTANVTLGR